MIQNENKKQCSSGLTIEMLCQGMACSQEEVKKLVDYTMSFDRRFIADEVVKLCQKEILNIGRKIRVFPETKHYQGFQSFSANEIIGNREISKRLEELQLCVL